MGIPLDECGDSLPSFLQFCTAIRTYIFLEYPMVSHRMDHPIGLRMDEAEYINEQFTRRTWDGFLAGEAFQNIANEIAQQVRLKLELCEEDI